MKHIAYLLSFTAVLDNFSCVYKDQQGLIFCNDKNQNNSYSFGMRGLKRGNIFLFESLYCQFYALWQ